MARSRRVKGGDEFSELLTGLSGYAVVEVMRSACYAGAGALADAVKNEIRGLPEESGYMHKDKKTGVIKKRNVVGTWDKEMLEQRLGISRIDSDADKSTVAIGFDGYNDRPTKKYPKGVPIPLIARSIESGSSVRQKNSFMRRAYNKAEPLVEREMKDAGQNKLNDIIKRGGKT